MGGVVMLHGICVGWGVCCALSTVLVLEERSSGLVSWYFC